MRSGRDSRFSPGRCVHAVAEPDRNTSSARVTLGAIDRDNGPNLHRLGLGAPLAGGRKRRRVVDLDLGDPAGRRVPGDGGDRRARDGDHGRRILRLESWRVPCRRRRCPSSSSGAEGPGRVGDVEHFLLRGERRSGLESGRSAWRWSSPAEGSTGRRQRRTSANGNSSLLTFRVMWAIGVRHRRARRSPD